LPSEEAAFCIQRGRGDGITLRAWMTPKEGRLGARWFLRETLFVIIGMILWGVFGWRVLWGIVPVALLNLIWFAKRSIRRGAAPRGSS
jgi:hypothetical protein